MGIKAYQDYRVINLWEVEANLVFQEKISTLLPFVPILKGGAEESVVREASLIIRLLTRRLGNLNLALTLQIQELSLPQLEALGESLLDFSNLDDLSVWLDEQGE